MTCALPGGITLRFLRSGLSISPYKANLRAKRRNYMHGQVVVSRDDGRLVKEQTEEAEPAILEFGGETSQRVYIGSDNIEFFNDYNDNRRARIDLLDSRKVLERGSVDRNYGQVSLQQVVTDILNEHADDPNNVIERVKYTNESDKERIITEFGKILSGTPEFRLPSLFSDFEEWLENQYASLEDDPGAVGATFNFEGLSPLQAMRQVMEEFEHQWWVDNDGTLYIGQDGTFGNIIATLSDNNSVVLRRYDVVETASKVNRVLAKSALPNTQKDDNLGPAVPDNVKTRLQSVAIAHAPSLDGERQTLESKQALTVGQLERSAARYLYERIMDDTNGSISINGLASQNQSAIAKIQPGDHFLVDKVIEQKCEPKTVSGHFLVTSVSHRATPQQGWKIDVNVSKVVPHNKIESQSFYYDPTTDSDYETLEEVQSKEATDIGSSFGVY